MIRFSHRNLAYCLLVFALSLRVAAAFVWQSQLEREDRSFRFGDSDSYWVIARNISDGKFEYGGENSKIFRAPLYPLILVPFAAGDLAIASSANSDAATTDTVRPSRRGVFLARILGCLFGTVCIFMFQISFFGLCLAFALLPLMHHVGWRNRFVRAAVYVPFLFIIAGLVLAGFSLFGMKTVFFGYGFHF